MAEKAKSVIYLCHYFILLRNFNERNELISRISDYYDIYNKDKEYVLAAYSKHLLYGYEDNSFRSERYTTRAEACVIISRMIKVGNFTNNNGGIIDNPILKNIIKIDILMKYI
mgnify:CR=1 FL=1